MRLQSASWKRIWNRPVAAMATALWCTVATATPEGGAFLYGDGSISYYGGGAVTIVQLLGSDRFIVGWNDFDVAAGESVTFNGVNFTVLNTINGGAPPSSWVIDGTINAPGGDVWFVNPAGVMFGESAVLDVGGLLAAAGTINAGDFIAGNDVFNLSGDVSFAGTMSTVNGLADRVILLGHRVVNTGLLQGNIIALASGDTIRLIDLGTRITLEIDGSALDGAVAATGTQASMDGTALVANHGHIETGEGGQVLMASGDALGAMLGDLAIEHDGEIISAGGTVELIALEGAVRTDQSWAGGNAYVTSAGLIDTSSQNGGGSIALTGPAVVVGSTLRSQGGSDGGGGTVSIRGSGSVVLAGSDVAGWSDAAAGHDGTGSISVSGGNAGHDGGTIELDAGDGRVVGAAAGALVAQGGLTGGNGGDVQISGGEMQWNTRVRTGAVNGDMGSVGYTSSDALRITADGSISIADFDNLLAAASGDSFIGAQLTQSLGYVDGNLSVHSDGRLTIETSLAGLPSDGPTRLVGDAVFSGTEIVLADASGSTELRAGGGLTLDGAVVMQNSDAVLLSGQRDGVSGTSISGTVWATGAYRGDLELSSPGVIEISGDIGIAGGEIGSLVLRSVGDMRFIGDTHAILAQGDVLLASLDGGPFTVTLEGNLTVQAGNDVLFGEGLSITVNDSLTAIAGGALVNRAVADVAGDLTFIGGTVDNHTALTVGGDLALTATAGSLQSNDALSSGGNLALTSDTGDVLISGSLDADGSIALAAQGDITATAAIIAHGTEANRGLISITTPGSILLTGPLSASGDSVELNAGVDIELAGDINVAGSVDVAAGNDLVLAAGIEADTVALQAGNMMVLDGAIIASVGTDLIGSTAVQLAAPTINVIGDSSITAVNGLMKLVGTEGALDTLAQVNLDDAALHMETQEGAIVFAARADGDGDLSLSAEQGVLYIGGDLGSDTALRSITIEGSYGLQLGGIVPLDPSGESFDVNTLTADGLISLQAENVNAIQGGVASIRGYSDAMTITSNAGDIVLGVNQGFVQLGDLTMQAAGVIDVTDVTALGDLTFDAAILRVHRRNSVALVDADGSVVMSPQTSIVAGGDLIVRVDDLGGSGPGDAPLFGALGSVTGIPEDQVAQPTEFQRTDLVLVGPQSTTSLLLRWLASTDPDAVATDSALIAAESQSTQRMPVLLFEANEDLVTDAALSEMGIVLRPLDEHSSHTSRLGRPGTVSVDLVSGPGPAQAGRVVVTRTRLLAEQVRLAVEDWQSAWANGAGVRALGVSGPASIKANAMSGLTNRSHRRGLDRGALLDLQRALKATYHHLALAGLTHSEIEASKQYVIHSLVAQGAPADDAVAALR